MWLAVVVVVIKVAVVVVGWGDCKNSGNKEKTVLC